MSILLNLQEVSLWDNVGSFPLCKYWLHLLQQQFPTLCSQFIYGNYTWLITYRKWVSFIYPYKSLDIFDRWVFWLFFSKFWTEKRGTSLRSYYVTKPTTLFGWNTSPFLFSSDFTPHLVPSQNFRAAIRKVVIFIVLWVMNIPCILCL